MIKTLFKLAFRNLWKRKAYFFINLLGLTVGLLSFILIMEYVIFERSYDSFHKNAARIYRIGFNWGEIDNSGKNTSLYATNVPVIGAVLQRDIPEVESYTKFVRVLIMSPICVITRYEHDEVKLSINAENGYYADENFLKIFSFPLVKGDINALKQPNKVVLTESFVNRLFGKLSVNEVVGKTIRVNANRSETYEVGAVVKDIPENSHLQFDYLLSWSSLSRPNLNTEKWWSQFYTYVVCKPNTSLLNLESKLPAVAKKLYGSQSTISLFAQPLKDIYLTSDLREETGTQGSSSQVWLLNIIAYAVLLIAWINYMSMFLAKSMERANEVGIKKVLGASRGGLALQFFCEAFVINFISLIIAIVSIFFIQGDYNNWLGKDLTAIFVNQGYVSVWILFAIFMGSIITGFYPAMVLTSYQPLEILGGRLKASTKGILFQRSLTYFQFITSFIFVTSTLIVGRQLDFMRNHETGMRLDGCIAFRSPGGNLDSLDDGKVSMFRERLHQYSFIKEASFTSSIPGKNMTSSAGMRRPEDIHFDGNNVFRLEVDHEFLDTYGIQLRSGRNFSKTLGLESRNIIINEAAMTTLKFSSAAEAIGKKVYWGEELFTIIGVISNYNHVFLQENYEPIMLHYNNAPRGFLTIKVEPNHEMQSIGIVKNELSEVFSSKLTDYQFLTNSYANQYHKINQFDILTKYFAVISILISCLGLFALSTYAIQNKLKEIAVRKVYGASVRDIVVDLTKPYLILIIFSTIIGSVITFFLMQNWLNNFAFRISLSPVDFCIPTLFLFFMVLTTLAYNCIKSALQNPIISLKEK